MNDRNYNIKRINDYKWEIETDKLLGMRVPGIIFADKEILEHARIENTIDQVVNAATLPGILKASFAMPDIHFGYGFPIGGVAAFDMEEGIISPGGVGFDISCGVRAMRTNLGLDEVGNRVKDLMQVLSVSIPRGLGKKGKIKLSGNDMRKLLSEGVSWAVKKNYGWEEDIGFIEEKGCMEAADPGYVGKNAIDRGSEQVGTLGSGNHFLEVQVIDCIYDSNAADILDIEEGQVIVMIHSGSRGLGHQVCSDHIREMQQAYHKYNIEIPDRQLACAPLRSPEAKKYYGAMSCAVNYALVNRHCLAHWTREAFEKVFEKSSESLGLSTIYDVSHNIARIEKHDIGNGPLDVCVHRKGATRSFGPGHPDLPEIFQDIGQPVIIPGDMGTNSYILCGTANAMKESFGSTCHGAGRLISRSRARKIISGQKLKEQLESKGIIIVADSTQGLAEEAPQAYKDIGNVVKVASSAGLSRKVARLRPIGVIKG
jgi:tRNA-splicing ligase RtcB (3'-phosphate/5'-hydroxy nucleic acid ligase)